MIITARTTSAREECGSEGAPNGAWWPEGARARGCESAPNAGGYMKAEEFFQKQDVVLIHAENFYDAEEVFFNMGLLSIATTLVSKNYKVVCLNPHQIFTTSNEELIKFFRLYSPAVVGFYTIADNIFIVKEIAALIKKVSKDIKIAVGGPQACALEGKILEDKNFDIVVLGEGENTFPQIVEHCINGKIELKNIKGIIYRDGDNIVKTEDAVLIENLDELPYPMLLLGGHNKNVYPIITGRGCPYNCVFCFKGVFGDKYRYRSAEKVVEEIIMAVEQFGFSSISILDDTFVANVERAKKICRKLIDYQKISKKKIAFFCFARVDILFKNPELLEIMAECGFEAVQIGIESGSQKMLDAYDKKINLEEITEVVKKCYELNIANVMSNFILGGPGETKSTVEDSIKFAEKLIDMAPGMISITVTFLSPYINTPIYKDPEKFGLKILDTEFKTGLSMLEPHIQTKALLLRDLNNLKLQFSSVISNYMTEKVPFIHPSKIAKHFYLAKFFGHRSRWLTNCYMGFPALAAFFNFSLCPRFVILNSIDGSKWKNAHPMRVMLEVIYEPWDDSIVLRGSFREIRITNKIEKEAYRYAAGKLKAVDIVKEIKNKFNLKETEEEIWDEKIKPFYSQLEKLYYLAFYD